MSFQDDLLRNMRTKEEVEKENNDAEISEIIKSANETFKKIKSEIIRAANNGDYTIISDRKVITVTVFSEYYYCMRSEIPATFEKVRNSFFDSPQSSLSFGELDDHIKALRQLSTYEQKHYHLIFKTRRKTIFEPKNASKYQLFWKELKRLTAIDNIEITPVIIDEENNKEYTFPCTIERDISWDKYSSLIKCVCTIPEQYSTDVPIEVDISLIETIPEETTKAATSQSIISIDTMEGHQFEVFCADILSKNGFMDVEVTRGSGDQGIDIIAYKDGVKFGIQCKCYSSDVGNKAIQEAFSGKTYYKCHVGVVLTNRYFTRSAIELSKNNGILLWDRGYLIDMMNKSGIKFNV